MQRYESRMNVMEWAERKKEGSGKLSLQEWVAGREVCSPPTDLVERVAVNARLYSKPGSV